MEEWKEYKLRDFLLIPIRNGLTKPSAIRGQGVKMIGMKEIFAMDYIRSVEMDRVPVTNKEYESSEIMKYDLLFARQSLTLEGAGKCSIVVSVDEPTVFESHLIRLRIDTKKANPFFIYYYYKSSIGKNQIKSLVQQVAAAGIRGKELIELGIKVPHIEKQNQIVSILKSLDDKIEVNRKINENLEQQAQALFKSWFVDFEPFKDQPFVESELGMIPEGWKVGTLGEIGEIVGGSTPSKAKPEYYTEHGIAWLTPKDLSVSNNKFTSRGDIDITQEGYDSCSTKLMPQGSVLFSSRAPIGYITIAKNDICTNQGFKSVVPKLAGTAFIYHFLKTSTKEIENKATGSTFKEASGALMKSLQLIIAPQIVLDDFEQVMKPILREQEIIEDENSRLASLRDTLLPRLMSGELKVNDLNI